jgi:type I restriction enzyme, R subunit
MPSLAGERKSVQNPLVRYAVEAGWTYLSPADALARRRGEGEAVLHDVLVAQLQRLNPGVVDLARAEELVRRLTRVPPTIEGNLAAWEYLRGRRTVFVPAANRERDVRFLDPDHPEANQFHVTDELTFDNGVPPAIRADVVFFVNGVPVIIVETKSAKRMDGIAEALDQIRRYERDGAEFLALLQLATLTHLVQFYYAATWGLSRKGLFNWRDEQAGDFETLVKSFVQPRRVLTVLHEFILFTRRDGALSKVVLRPHQMRAVQRVEGRARDPERRRALIWHTQGSGKTYTMIVVAQRLIEDAVFENPTVLMLVDRNELEQQLFQNLESIGLGHAPVATSKAHLRQLLRDDYRGLVVSTIHKFDEMPPSLCTRANVFVLVDEAHRSTGGDLGNYLLAALPNATFVGFTGTPIDRSAHGGGTFKTFGVDDPQGYLDKYSIRESIADGTTVPLHYALSRSELLVDRETLERDFLQRAELEGVSDVDELNRVLDRAVTLKNMLKNPERVALVAAEIARHFRESVEPLGYKAFVVAVDREACVLYKRALDAILPSEYSRVVISGAHDDPQYLRPYHLDEDAEKRVRKDFVDRDALPRILIVTDKLLTGFDAPVLYCLYLDKPMRDHVLLQAIARVNRPYEDAEGRPKPAGFVLDFVGIFNRLQDALAFDSQDVESVVEGLDVLKDRFADQMDQARKEYLPITAGLRDDKALEAVLEHFRDRDVRHAFYQYFRELQELYEIITPDAYLSPFMADYKLLTEMYEVLRASYEPGVPIDRSLYRRTCELVQEHTHTRTLKPPTRIHKIDAAALERLAAEPGPDTVRVFNLLRAIQALVEEQGAQAPHLIPIGERAEHLAQLFEERLSSAEDALRELEALVREVRAAEEARRTSDLSPEGFAVQWLLQRQGVAAAEAVARQAMVAFAAHPHWARAASQERDVRLALYKALRAAGVKDLPAVVDHLLDTLRRAQP